MDRLQSMAVLIAVVEKGSLSSASRHLGMPLATVSRKVSDLEAHLKMRLINRSSRRLSLTDAGSTYVSACKRILEDIGEAERAASGEYSMVKGELTMTAPIAFGRLHVLPIVMEFLKAYPEIDIRMIQADRMIHLVDEHIDLAIRIGHLPDSALLATRVGSIRRIACASPAYFAKRGMPVTPSNLAEHDCIVFDGPVSSGTWAFLNGKSETLVPIRSRLTVNTAEAAVDAAVAGLGIARVLAYQAESAIRAGDLALALEAFEPEPSPVSLVHAGGRLPPLKLRAFVDFAAPRLKTRLWQGDPSNLPLERRGHKKAVTRRTGHQNRKR